MKFPLKALAATTLAAAFALPTFAASAPQAYGRLHDKALAGAYQVDPDHSSVQFTIGHAGVALCSGVFKKVTGSYTFDPSKPSADKADITIAVDSLDTFLPMRDDDLKKGKQFFDATEYPQIHFVSSRYVPKGRDHGLLYGDITLHGVTKPAVFKVELVGAGKVGYLPKPWGGYLSGFVATTTINRMDFGVDAYAAGLSHKVAVRVEIEGVRQGE